MSLREVDETAHLVVNSSPDDIEHRMAAGSIKVYKRRWYILIIFTLLNTTGNILWNTWPPIQETCQLVLGWNKTNVLIIGALQALGSIISIVPSAWLLDTKGLRFAVLCSISLQTFAVICELIPAHPEWRTVFITFAEFLISVAVPAVQNAGVLVLSATWFPPHERMTATAIATLASYLGSAFSYIVGPHLVPDVDYGNLTKYETGQSIDIDTLRNHTTPEQMKFLLSRINDYLFIEAVLVGVLLFTVLIYFPAKPPSPPSLSSAAGRLDFCSGAKTLLKNRSFWLLLLIFSVSNGVNWGWSSVQDLIFSGVGIDQKTAGWLGFSANVASLLVFFASGISQVVLFCGTVPLIMELAAECTYPVAEGITSGVMVLSVYVINLIFFIAFMFPQASPRWMNWLLVSSTVVCIPLIAVYKAKYKRLDVDESKQS
ncbi:hypothetical protein pdam_00005147 [Pocillopora damicornis]|uniref:Major facilitator superfamily (MFS) profile domain-containing protein n=1 Tax=Pocillopora damicornis TaxID=46731 RepID=A0A3M6TNN6_POCDA|nr:hypothetical protein pdam_00005147 [Pocillopora damicornis]